MIVLIHSRRRLVAALDMGGIHRLNPQRPRRRLSVAIVVIEIGVGEAVWLITCRALPQTFQQHAIDRFHFFPHSIAVIFIYEIYIKIVLSMSPVQGRNGKGYAMRVNTRVLRRELEGVQGLLPSRP